MLGRLGAHMAFVRSKVYNQLFLSNLVTCDLDRFPLLI
jgi:hypothetical protein